MNSLHQSFVAWLFSAENLQQISTLLFYSASVLRLVAVIADDDIKMKSDLI